MHIFYTPHIQTLQELSEEESLHCVKVLRLTEGEQILLADGVGTFYKATIAHAHAKRCAVAVEEVIPSPNPWRGKIHIAIAPTKNMDRLEWFTEKATEIGVDAITLLKCRYSERKEVKLARIEKTAISAMKQSLKAVLPQLGSLTPFEQFVTQPFEGEKFIAHCYPDQPKVSLKEAHTAGADAIILIGPEGDFSEEEVALALAHGFKPITLGESRLRTETAGVVACHTLQLINQ